MVSRALPPAVQPVALTRPSSRPLPDLALRDRSVRPGVCSGVGWAVLRWPLRGGSVPLTEVSGSKIRSQGVAADPPRFPQRIGPKRPVRRHGAPPVSRPNRGRRAVRCGPKGRRMSPVWLASARHEGGSGRPNDSLGRVPASAGAAASVPLGGTRRDDLWRGRAGFRSGSLALSGPARGTSGRIGGQWGQWDALATSCVRGEVGRRRRSGSGPAWVQRRAGPGEGGRGDFRSPRVPSGPGGPPPQD